MVALGYGTPTIIRGEVGVFLELLDPVSVALMGQVSMSLPDADPTLVGVQIDILGIVEE